LKIKRREGNERERVEGVGIAGRYSN